MHSANIPHAILTVALMILPAAGCRQKEPRSTPGNGGMGHSGMGHSGMGHSGMAHSGMAHSGMAHGGMGPRRPPPRVRIPKARPYLGKALGEIAWHALAVAPDGKRVAVASPGLVRLLGPGNKVLWRGTGPQQPLHIAFGAQGKEVAVLGRDSAHQEHLIVLHTATGKNSAEERYNGLPSPQSRRGRVPPNTPTSFAPAPNGRGYWIGNPFGHYLARPGKSRALKILPGASGSFYADQSGAGLWKLAGSGKAVVHLPSKRVLKLPCYPHQFIGDSGRKRVGAVCWKRGQPTTLRVLAHQSGVQKSQLKLPGFPGSSGLLASGEAIVLMPRARRVGWIGPKGARWKGFAGKWNVIEVAHHGRYAAGIAQSGELQVLALPKGKLLCDHTTLPPAFGVGFEGKNRLWLLGYHPGSRFKTGVFEVALPSCKVLSKKPVNVSKSSNLLARYVPGAQGFVFNGAYPRSHGAVFLQVAPTVKLREIAPNGIGEPSVSPLGSRFAFVFSRRAELYRARPFKTLKVIRPSLKVAPCEKLTMSYGGPKGWVRLDASGSTPRGSIRTGHPDAQSCRDGSLVVAGYNNVYVIDARAPKLRKTLRHGMRMHAVSVLPGGASALLANGPTGWRLLSLK